MLAIKGVDSGIYWPDKLLNNLGYLAVDAVSIELLSAIQFTVTGKIQGFLSILVRLLQREMPPSYAFRALAKL